MRSVADTHLPLADRKINRYPEFNTRWSNLPLMPTMNYRFFMHAVGRLDVAQIIRMGKHWSSRTRIDYSMLHGVRSEHRFCRRDDVNVQVACELRKREAGTSLRRARYVCTNRSEDINSPDAFCDCWIQPHWCTGVLWTQSAGTNALGQNTLTTASNNLMPR